MSWIYVWTSEIKNIYVWTTPVKEVFVWTTKVRPTWWQPWANTIAYYKLDWNLNDSSWNGNNASVGYWSAIYYTVSGDNKAFTCNGNAIKSWVQQQNILSSNHTLSFWIYLTWTPTEYRVMWALTASTWVSHIWLAKDNQYIQNSIFIWSGTDGARKVYRYTFSTWTRYNVVFSIWNSLSCSCYINWTQAWTAQTLKASWTWDFYFWVNYQLWNASAMNWYLDDIIIESKARTAQETADYYNLTKWNYGL